MLMVGQFSKPKSPVPPPAVKKVAYQPPVDPSTVDVLSVPIPVENLVNQELVAAQVMNLYTSKTKTHFCQILYFVRILPQFGETLFFSPEKCQKKKKRKPFFFEFCFFFYWRV